MEDVQAHLESIYGICCEERAEAFMVGPEAAAQLGCTGNTDEELLVHVADDGQLELALYLAPPLMARLSAIASDGVGQALETELGSYCQVAEGVSHFLYMAQAAERERTLSLLELEAQAEVDKFATCLLHRWKDGDRRWAKELHHRLFDRVGFLATLRPEERWRYEEANRLARGYCQRLIPHYVERRLDRLLGALRYCYRLGAEAKLQHLAA